MSVDAVHEPEGVCLHNARAPGYHSELIPLFYSVLHILLIHNPITTTEKGINSILHHIQNTDDITVNTIITPTTTTIYIIYIQGTDI